MSKYKCTLMICPNGETCGNMCTHGKTHEPIIIWRGGKQTNYCKMPCTANAYHNYPCCQPVKMNTKWDL